MAQRFERRAARKLLLITLIDMITKGEHPKRLADVATVADLNAQAAFRAFGNIEALYAAAVSEGDGRRKLTPCRHCRSCGYGIVVVPKQPKQPK